MKHGRRGRPVGSFTTSWHLARCGLGASTSTGPTRVIRRLEPTCPAIIDRSGISRWTVRE
jgi:hypothetical protein